MGVVWSAWAAGLVNSVARTDGRIVSKARRPPRIADPGGGTMINRIRRGLGHGRGASEIVAGGVVNGRPEHMEARGEKGFGELDELRNVTGPFSPRPR